ncbi:MAG TPA: hypothetical protein VM263_03560 [Acidimicrobiales bacterium]|nr:hypothetical protein [Acidimicrobiales bacterium]
MSTTALRAVGLEPGDAVRFRRRAGERWREGVAIRLERDGSVGLVDGKGAARAIPVERLEVGRPGRRGTLRWEPLADVAARDEQLGLFPAAPPRRPGRRRPPP